MSILITHIKSLLQVRSDAPSKVSGQQMKHLPLLDNAWLFIDGGLIKDFGSHQNSDSGLPEVYAGRASRVIDASGCMVMPAFCDSHTHLVYAGSREAEYVDKIKGISYEEIARRGGGILNSARRLQLASEQELFDSAWLRLEEILSLGTGAVEIKSGYGLTTESELKMLRVIRRLREESPITIKATFLGAHAVPAEYKGRQSDYVDLVINEMIPVVAGEGLADFIDVFCDKGFFTPQDTERILMAGIKHDLKPKIHANELDFSGGVQVGVKYDALSVDHLERSGEEEIQALLQSDTMPALLPGAALFLGLPYPPARQMIEAGLPVTLASDFNPGSSPSGNMQLVMSLGAILLRMLPEEIINAVTINGAYAMGVDDQLGSISKGKKANLFITKPIPSYAFLPYAYGSNKVEQVILNGILQ